MGTAVSISSPKATEQAKKGPQYSFGEGHDPARPPSSPGGTPVVGSIFSITRTGSARPCNNRQR